MSDNISDKSLLIERITAAAINQDGVIYTGAHHHHIIRTIATCAGIRPVTGAQGFITNRGRFVDRVEGLAIAREANQIVKKHGCESDLFSEDLWSVPDEITELKKRVKQLEEEIWRASLGKMV